MPTTHQHPTSPVREPPYEHYSRRRGASEAIDQEPGPQRLESIVAYLGEHGRTDSAYRTLLIEALKYVATGPPDSFPFTSLMLAHDLCASTSPREVGHYLECLIEGREMISQPMRDPNLIRAANAVKTYALTYEAAEIYDRVHNPNTLDPSGVVLWALRFANLSEVLPPDLFSKVVEYDRGKVTGGTLRAVNEAYDTLDNAGVLPISGEAFLEAVTFKGPRTSTEVIGDPLYQFSTHNHTPTTHHV